VSYLVKRITSNGYRCGCCRSEDESTDLVSNIDEALKSVPVEMPGVDDDFAISSVSVIDCGNEKEIAAGLFSYPQGYGKGNLYRFSRWSGHVRGDRFDIIEANRGDDVEGKSWSDILEGLKEETRLKDLEQAKQDKADADARIARLST